MYSDLALYTSLTFGWIGLHYYYNEYYLNAHNLTSRAVAYNHAVLSILFSGMALKYPSNRNLDTVYYTSVSFFIYETGVQLLKKNSLLKGAFLLHHMASIYTLQKSVLRT